MKNIILIGPSGSGKSTLGRLAAEATGYGFIDLDTAVERKTGMRISDIFRERGEPAFRKLESEAVREAAARTGYVVATGGGVVLDRENVRLLRASGLVIFLDRPQQEIARDIALAHRPLLAGGVEKLFDLIQTRRPLYESGAHAVLRNSGTRDEALAALLALIRREGLTGNYAVIGDPIGHTLSPRIHNAVFAALGVREHYRGIHVPRGALGTFMQSLGTSGIKGFNVTMPHKRDIIPYLDEIDEEARLCGAVNTVVVRDGKSRGYNTDMDGLLASIRDCGHEMRGNRVLILGAGGAASAIARKAAMENAAEVTVLARRKNAAEQVGVLVESALPVRIAADEMSDAALARHAARCGLLINATPLGMDGHAQDFASFDFLKAVPKHALVYDIVYAPPLTQLLRHAQAEGLATCGGLGMLIYQAVIADEYYLDRALDRKALYEVVRGNLAQHKGKEANDT